VHDPAAWAGQILCSEPERAAFQRLLGLGLKDSFRLFEQPEKSFSWWDYRMLGFQKNRGCGSTTSSSRKRTRRALYGSRHQPRMRKLERPSDHAPVTAELTELGRLMHEHRGAICRRPCSRSIRRCAHC
jgi:exodeoxyribonuclease-3